VSSKPLEQNFSLAAFEPSVSIDSNNNPVVAMYALVRSSENGIVIDAVSTFVCKWTGKVWEPVGQLVNYGVNGTLPSLLVSQNGLPTLLYQEYDGPGPIFRAETFKLVVKQYSR
jgi:hypothetical protein